LGSNLYELIKGARITIYKDDALRLAVSRTVAKETPRGMQLTKEKPSHKIDVVIALAAITSPPIMRASLREIARPSPVPP